MVVLDPHSWSSDDIRHIGTGHEYLLDSPDQWNPGPLFEGYDPHRPAPNVDPAKFRMRYGQGNITGYCQRAWLIWWALRELWTSGEIGLELGAGGAKTPWCLSTDGQTGLRSYYPEAAREDQREIIGGHMRVDASTLSAFRPGTFRAVFASHVMEHLSGDCVEHAANILRLLQPRGVFVGIMPDNNCFDVLACDYTHKHAFGSEQYRIEVLCPACLAVGAEIEEFTTFGTDFAYFWAVRRR